MAPAVTIEHGLRGPPQLLAVPLRKKRLTCVGSPLLMLPYIAIGMHVGVAVGVGDGDAPGHSTSASSTYMPVRSPKLSECTRNLTRTVCPAYGARSTVFWIQV